MSRQSSQINQLNTMSINHLNIAITSGTIKSLNHISNRSICKANDQLCNNTYTNRQLCNFLSRGRIRIRVNEVLEVPSWNRNRIILLIISNNGLIAQAKNKLKPMDQTISSQQLSINQVTNRYYVQMSRLNRGRGGGNVGCVCFSPTQSSGPHR